MKLIKHLYRIKKDMKKLLIPLIAILSTSSLLGCSSSKSRLTYGTLYHSSSLSSDNATIYSKKEKENFLLATYDDEMCGCWVYFSRALDVLAKRDNILTYKLHDDEIDDRLNAFGIKNSKDPAFYIIADGKVLKSYFYSDNDSLFTDENRLLNEITNNINLPYMYFINEAQIEDKIVKDGGIIYYTRMSCPDCSYCTPHVLMPYLKDKTLNDKIYVYDLDPLRKEDLNKYQEFKDNHYLSNKYNKELGYNTGYVPTFQYYKDSKLYDMAVYFNDEITDGVITTSYYDETRVNNLHYLDKLNKKVLTGTSLNSDELSSTGTWANQAAQNKYYQPFLEAFLDTYLK